jgi:Icc-related predicted phosphoesterase
LCYFVSDLHGSLARYQKLFEALARERPEAVFMGGDLLPLTWCLHGSPDGLAEDFVEGFLLKNLLRLKRTMGGAYPRFFLIMGNDDCRADEEAIVAAAAERVWDYIPNRGATFKEFDVYGYPYVPPTPFRLKDWERYDVSRYVDPGSVSPEEGLRSVPVPDQEKRYATIQEDLERLAGRADLSRAIFLFHAPPYRTNLDLSTLEPKMVDHVPLDRHLGSVAVRRFIEARQPLLTLHGHIHEAARVSRSWRDMIGRTFCFSAAHDGPELALVRFEPEDPASATREEV